MTVSVVGLDLVLAFARCLGRPLGYPVQREPSLRYKLSAPLVQFTPRDLVVHVFDCELRRDVHCILLGVRRALQRGRVDLDDLVVVVLVQRAQRDCMPVFAPSDAESDAVLEWATTWEHHIAIRSIEYSAW